MRSPFLSEDAVIREIFPQPSCQERLHILVSLRHEVEMSFGLNSNAIDLAEMRECERTCLPGQCFDGRGDLGQGKLCHRATYLLWIVTALAPSIW